MSSYSSYPMSSPCFPWSLQVSANKKRPGRTFAIIEGLKSEKNYGHDHCKTAWGKLWTVKKHMYAMQYYLFVNRSSHLEARSFLVSLIINYLNHQYTFYKYHIVLSVHLFFFLLASLSYTKLTTSISMYFDPCGKHNHIVGFIFHLHGSQNTLLTIFKFWNVVTPLLWDRHQKSSNDSELPNCLQQ